MYLVKSVAALASLALFVAPAVVSIELNCKGSIRCKGHRGRLNDLQKIINDNMPTSITVSSSRSIACISTIGNGLGSSATHDSGLCVFLQNTNGEAFGKPQILSMLSTLDNPAIGTCQACGSIPTGWPENNSTTSFLTVNFVYNTPCDGYCSYSQDKSGGAIPNVPPGYAPGNCTLHVTQYQPKKTSEPMQAVPEGDYEFDFNVRDANGIDIGNSYGRDGAGNVTLEVESLLPHTISVGAVGGQADLIGFSYPNMGWWTSLGSNCNWGKYNGGERNGDCTFTC